MKEDINLLPLQFIAKRRRRLYLDGIGRFLQRIYILLLLIVLTLLVVWMAIRSVTGRLDSREENSDLTRLDVSEEIAGVNALLGRYAEKQKATIWSLRLEEIIEKLPEGVSLTKISVVEEIGPLEIVGVSQTRSAVVALQQRLEDLEWVDRVEAPLQNFALGPESGFTFDAYPNDSLAP